MKDSEVEAVARAIALNHDLDPDDCRLGYPAWQIPWVLADARAAIAALDQARAKER